MATAKKIAPKASTPKATAAKKPAVNATTKTTAKAAAVPAKKAVVAKPVKPVAAPAAARTAKAEKPRKPKLVRDSFTIPKAEYTVLDTLKARAAKLAHPAKKSEVLRAGIMALAAMSDTALIAALAQVPAIKTGRPSKA